MGNGRLLLQRPFQEVLELGKPDFPFCLCWANHEWTTKTWQKDGKNKVIAPMEYGGEEDYTKHFNYVLPAFKDKRYITIDGKPIFVKFVRLGAVSIVKLDLSTSYFPPIMGAIWKAM